MDIEGIVIRNGDYTAEIYLVQWLNLPVRAQDKLIKLAIAEDYRNGLALDLLESYLLMESEAHKRAWVDASAAYRDGYDYPDFYTNPMRKMEAEQNNQRLLRAVQRAKAAYDRIQRRIKLIKERQLWQHRNLYLARPDYPTCRFLRRRPPPWAGSQNTASPC